MIRLSRFAEMAVRLDSGHSLWPTGTLGREGVLELSRAIPWNLGDPALGNSTADGSLRSDR